ncbi:MAG: hypothetical protein M0R74_00940 [Dehalococcoidia bacterium]|nr:hypothetical protein [Dehalococcoidia bacterium]
MALTLAVVESAIESLISGSQAFSVGGLSYTKASLPALWEARSILKAEEDRSTRPTVRAFNFGASAYGDTSGTEGDIQLTSTVTS